jgi:hypothetical protein
VAATWQKIATRTEPEPSAPSGSTASLSAAIEYSTGPGRML